MIFKDPYVLKLVASITLSTAASVFAAYADAVMLQDRTALGMKLEDEMELPRVKWENYRHSAKAGIGKATVKFSGRKESAVGANAEYQVVAGEKENIQVHSSRGREAQWYLLVNIFLKVILGERLIRKSAAINIQN